ncbi:MAG TPA: AI-2E family transporter [Stellaceae bacterium]
MPAAGRPFSAPETLIIGALVVAALYVGREVFVPLALATLLGFVLAPLVRLLRRFRLGRVSSVLVAVVLAFAVIGGLGAVIGSQVAHLAGNLPEYQATIARKLSALRGSATEGGIVEHASSLLKNFGDEVKKTGEPAAPAAPAPAAAPGAHISPPQAQPEPQKPIPVEIQEPPPTPLQVVQSLIAPLLSPLATTGVVIIFLIFILLQREDLRDRFIRLAGSHDLQRTTTALDDAAARLSRYFLMQSAINACFGVIVGGGLWLIGVPNPALWGILGALLRFVPYVGAPIAAIFPAALAIAVDPGWSMLLWTAVLFLVTELVMGQVVEPLLYGHSTGLSAVAVVVSAAFWTWLWGPIGLLLSTPLTVCLVVLGRHVEHLQFLDVMLGDRPALAPEESFYQRVLAGDSDEVAEQAEAFLATNSLTAYYDEVARKGLALAQLDASREALDEERRQRIKETIDEVIDDLSDHEDVLPAPKRAAAADDDDGAAAAPTPPPPVLRSEELAPEWRGEPVLCIAGRGTLDLAAAAMLAQLLEKHGIGARTLPTQAVSASNLPLLDTTGVRMICLSYLDAGSFTHARFLARRLRRRLPSVPIVVGLLTLAAQDEGGPAKALTATGADHIAASFREAVEHVLHAAQDAAPGKPAAQSQQEPSAPAAADPKVIAV